MHPVGPLTCQIDQGFRGFTQVVANAELVTRIHLALHASLVILPKLTTNIFNKVAALPKLSQCCLPKHNTKPIFSTCSVCCTLPTIHFPSYQLLQCPVLYLASRLPISEERAGTAWKSHSTKILYTGLFISPSGIFELDCATTKTDTAERSISISRESLQVFFLY